MSNYSDEFIVNLDRDLLYAYRKTKVDLYYGGLPYRSKLVKYEDHLLYNLNRLKEALLTGSLKKYIFENGLDYYLAPKKIHFDMENNISDDTVIFSNFSDQLKHKQIKPYDFRLFADVSIDFHVITTLWILRIGEKLEKNLPESAYANRIRRSEKGTQNITYNSLGTFGPYYHQYK